ncbi:putative N-acetylmannosamine-6-phosphate epimerase [Chthonomonas calidirosea]|uniref:N-acylglucosamine-6-phosphate 2-epimerase n=1 Tax=Chthonomonas calidirosea (strain DSM 23976 / ICMP 18418 / T49) TaxID=1303518 RepID=S0ES94_CHTCT|nr:N-acetylmannosamine-6-phosphate 2-epimerase [Chthonomonas calidirosea]CCW33964.1 Putative N-acetylmannosamine-6-phosphate epimerase [Chthonomonas calidirosea T49]CEK15036.1 putative N-acetylmannosamine-6-phosphate epimerase [Chthonomonas calidirosea]CEK16155.1 putative N-acetylmannosamine-6-phosphate epimerase [Chthonomonas calidirosea]
MIVKQQILQRLKGGIIVSCQANPSTPLGRPEVLAALAAAAEQGGAVGIRADGPANVAAIAELVSVPIIAIYKQVHPGFEVYITPTPQAAQEVFACSTPSPAIIAFDATDRPRPNGYTWQEILRFIQNELGALAMADISTFEEGLAAAEAGVDLVATTLSGYTAPTAFKREQGGPDLELVSQLAQEVPCPIICEGRIRSPQEAYAALCAGAWAVVVGTAITAIDRVTANYVAAMKACTR